MAIESNKESKTCKHCQKPGSLTCIGCKHAPNLNDGLNPAHYCSKECQVADWGVHKDVCKQLKNRKLFHRVGHLLQQLFYKQRERGFDSWVSRIEYHDGNMLIYDGASHQGTTELFMEDDVLKHFPEEMCRCGEDRKALLAFLACSDAIEWMPKLIRYVLGGISSEITEISLIPKAAKRATIGIWRGSRYDTNIQHDVWGVTLKHKAGKFVLDLAGAQFGFYEPITGYEGYMKERVQEVLRIRGIRQDNLKGTQSFIIQNALDQSDDSFQAAWMQLTRSMSKKLGRWLWDSVKDWEKTNISISELLSSRPAEFEKKAKELTKHVDAHLVFQIEDLKAKCQERKKELQTKRDQDARWQYVLLDGYQSIMSLEDISL